jgi:MFS transporter, ACS family, tartrate transporter
VRRFFGFGAGLFSIGYALCEIPSNLALYRFGARRWIARIMLTWGLLAMGMMFVKTPPQFYAMRFVLGIAEAGFFPGIMFYMLQWFPANLHSRTVSRFYAAAPLVAIANGLLAGPLMGLQGRLGLRGWQWLFLLEGFPAVLLSIVFLVQLPDTPEDARWLSLSERAWLKASLAADIRTGTHLDDTWASLRDKRIWLCGRSPSAPLPASLPMCLLRRSYCGRRLGSPSPRLAYSRRSMVCLASSA